MKVMNEKADEWVRAAVLGQALHALGTLMLAGSRPIDCSSLSEAFIIQFLFL